ncbi:MAG: DUF2971 domain-containing protein [Defluviitaleaceae bacterium]|nr:DUF2971 domain-containing protein [Defluviitaleaceae bacterium]
MSDIIYHYTSPEGILGILKGKTLRFTDCQYLNDKSEALYIRKPIERALEMICEKYGISTEQREFLNLYMKLGYESSHQIDKPDFGNINSINQKMEIYRYYVLCASEHEDASNMWSYFVKNGVYQGYNLGIDLSMLKKKIGEICKPYRGISVLPDNCIEYEFNKQVDIIFNKLGEAMVGESRLLAKRRPNKDLIIYLILRRALFNALENYKLFFKNPAFENEKEYRVVLKVRNGSIEENDNLKLNFRVGASGIITPFLEFSFDLNDKQELFKQITLAPMIETELAKESFNMLLASNGYKNIEIKESSINLRF